jgi:hypothetical protein
MTLHQLFEHRACPAVNFLSKGLNCSQLIIDSPQSKPVMPEIAMASAVWFHS